MRVEPHHAIDHVNWPKDNEWVTISGGYETPIDKIDYNIGWQSQAQPLDWYTFVTKPWIGLRGPMDYNISQHMAGYPMHAQCIDDYNWVDVAPCSTEDSKPMVIGLGGYKYEYQHDGSERGFSSITDLRREKVLNHLSVKDFRGTKAFFNYRFEDLNMNGTAALLRSVEEATGLQAKCNATLGKADSYYRGRRRRRELAEKKIVHHDKLSNEFVKWVDKYVDWEVESLIGYSKRGGDDEKKTDDEEAEAPVKEEEEKKEGVDKPNNDEPVKQIILLGERHSGTNWITDHLNGCFDIKVSTRMCLML